MSMVPTDTAERQAPARIGEQLKSKESQFKAALPAHIPHERFMRVVMTAIQNNPALERADRASLWTSSIKAAQDGLLPDGREGALVIYRTKDGDRWVEKVQWMPMIAGIRKKVRNSGEIATWDAHVVHEKDQFEYELGDDPFIKHRPSFDKNPGAVIAAYSVATLKTGEKSREIMTISQLEKVRGASKSKDKGPWVDWFEEMCRKTVARRHSKVLPVSTDLDDLIRRDDQLYDMTGAREQAKAIDGGKPLSLAGRFDALAAGTHDQQPRETAGQAGEEVSISEPPATERPTLVEAAPAVEQPAANPAHVALLDKLRPKARQGTKKLRLAISTISEADEALLTDADHEELGALADDADRPGEAA